MGYKMFPLIFPYKAYGAMFKLGMQTSQMLMFSSQVIFKRSQMIAQGMLGERSWADPEFTKLWQEKIVANTESYNSMNKSIVKKALSRNRGDAENNLIDGIKAITASTLPYYKKTGSNARRLRNKGNIA